MIRVKNGSSIKIWIVNCSSEYFLKGSFINIKQPILYIFFNFLTLVKGCLNLPQNGLLFQLDV